MRSSNAVKILGLVTIMKDSSAVPGTFIRSTATVNTTKNRNINTVIQLKKFTAPVCTLPKKSNSG